MWQRARVGAAFVNAMAESVFATRKTELMRRRSWPTPPGAGNRVFSYLERFDYIRRRHPRLANLSLTDYEAAHPAQNEVSG